MRMRNKFNKLMRELHKKDELSVLDFDQTVFARHQDGSEFKFVYGKVQREKVGDLDVTVVFSEHLPVMMFIEVDMDFIKVKPRKGRTYKLKLQDDEEVFGKPIVLKK